MGPRAFIKSASQMAAVCEMAIIEVDATLASINVNTPQFKTIVARSPERIVGVYHATETNAEDSLRAIREDVEAWVNGLK